MSKGQIIGIDGTTRKAYYGDGEQPWDTILRLKIAAPFAAGNVLKYLRRSKNRRADLEKAQWYWSELLRMDNTPDVLAARTALDCELTGDEVRRLRG